MIIFVLKNKYTIHCTRIYTFFCFVFHFFYGRSVKLLRFIWYLWTSWYYIFSIFNVIEHIWAFLTALYYFKGFWGISRTQLKNCYKYYISRVNLIGPGMLAKRFRLLEHYNNVTSIIKHLGTHFLLPSTCGFSNA